MLRTGRNTRNASEGEKLTWGYESLRSIEDHAAFHLALSGYVQEPGVRPVVMALLESPIDQVIAHSEQLSEMKRFDLMLNTGLRWVVGAVERG